MRNLLLKQSLRFVILFTPTNQPHANCHNGRQWTFSPAAQDEYSRAESRRFVQEMETGARDIYDCHGKNQPQPTRSLRNKRSPVWMKDFIADCK